MRSGEKRTRSCCGALTDACGGDDCTSAFCISRVQCALYSTLVYNTIQRVSTTRMHIITLELSEGGLLDRSVRRGVYEPIALTLCAQLFSLTSLIHFFTHQSLSESFRLNHRTAETSITSPSARAILAGNYTTVQYAQYIIGNYMSYKSKRYQIEFCAAWLHPEGWLGVVSHPLFMRSFEGYTTLLS